MSKPIKFIHTADIHLGRELSVNGLNHSENENLFRTAGKRAFENLVELAVSREVDFILIAGDLYDREARSVKASRFFLEKAEELQEKDIDLFLISGNHDPAGVENGIFELPANVHYFSSEEVETFEYQKAGRLAARIIGQSYRQKFESRTMYNYYTAADNSVFNIGLLHTALTKDNSRYVPVNKGELLSKKEIDYWALGHIHQFEQLNKKPAVYFSGTLQAHNISEEGQKGAILVEVDSNLKSIEEFIPLAPVIYRQLEIDLTAEDLNNISQLQSLLQQRIEELRDKINRQNKKQEFAAEAVIIRLLLKGRTELHRHVENNSEELEETLLAEFRRSNFNQSPGCWLHSIIFRTAKSLPELAELRNSNPLYKNLEALISDILAEEELNQELLAEWGEIWQGTQDPEDRENHKFYPDQKLQQEIMAEAKRIIISELIEDGD